VLPANVSGTLPACNFVPPLPLKTNEKREWHNWHGHFLMYTCTHANTGFSLCGKDKEMPVPPVPATFAQSLPSATASAPRAD
jgi:hypothetical protein